MLYQVQRDGQMYGPYTRQDLERYVATGNVLETDFVKSEEMTGWIPVTQLLASSAAAPPPLAEPGATGYTGSVAGGGFLFGSPSTELVGQFDWYPVAPWKFVLMSVCTLGFYQLYWIYRQWNRVKRRTDGSIMVWARTLFAGIWNFALFAHVRDAAREAEIPVWWHHVALGIAVILFALVARLPGLGALINLFSFVAYLPVVITIQRLNRRRAGTIAEGLNERLTVWNWVGLGFGSVFILLIVIGLVAGKTPASSNI